MTRHSKPERFVRSSCRVVCGAAALLVVWFCVATPAFAYREPRDYRPDQTKWGCGGPCHQNADGSSLDFRDPAVHADCESCHGPYDILAGAGTKFPFAFLGGTGPHGKYTSTSNRCQTCHTVHGGLGATFKLQPGVTVSDTCFVCHDGTGGQGVYGAIRARGLTVGGGHPIVSTSTVPGGSATTGGTSTVIFREPGGALTCSDCHSPHGTNLVAAYVGDRRRTQMNMLKAFTPHLLKQRPTGGDTTVAVYGSDWCLSCHKGRSSGGIVHNHPVDSLQVRADAFNYSKIVVSDHHSDGAFYPDMAGQYGSLGGREDSWGWGSMPTHAWDYFRSNRGYLMPYPRYPRQVGHAPICQQCHEDTRDPGVLVANGADASVSPSFAGNSSADGTSSYTGTYDNPRFQTFPHETENDKLVIETGDNLCLNCHPPTVLP